MPDLYHTLHNYDAGFIRIIAELWGLETPAQGHNESIESLCASLLDPESVRETLEVLPGEARACLTHLFDSKGKLEWAAFTRRYGEIREMGSSRRDREQPHLHPVSTAEILYYRGLLAKAFLDAGKGLQEFAYIPDDLLPLIRLTIDAPSHQVEPLGRPATPLEKSMESMADDHILDDATTLLAALRISKADFPSDPQLMALLGSARILRNQAPDLETVKSFLAAPSGKALEMLYEAWRNSPSFDELRLNPEIVCEGEWKNDPLSTRSFIITLLTQLPPAKWWSLTAFLRDLKTRHPDFQRPAGDYDSWFVKRAADGTYLRGFAYWDQVEGAVVRTILQLLHRLGRADLARSERDEPVTAFRLSTPRIVDETETLSISTNGKVRVARSFPRKDRYQLARFCEWEQRNGDGFIYRLSARSLQAAARQGLKAEQLLSLLVRHTRENVPPSLVEALKRWGQYGSEARMEHLAILRVTRPEVLEQIRKSKAGKFLGEVLSPTMVVVHPKAAHKVMAVLAELGILAEVENDG